MNESKLAVTSIKEGTSLRLQEQEQLATQGDKFGQQVANTFGFNGIQSQLSLGYQ